MSISVCMATYNGAAFIREQIESILSQLGPEDELIVSDDGSYDETIEIIKEYKDKRLVLVSPNRRKKGPAFNFENALKQAKGEILFLSDQDDIWMPNKVEILCEKLEHADLVFSDAFIIDRNGEKHKEHFCSLTPIQNVFENLLFNPYFGATMAFKRRVLEKALPFPAYIPMHDQWLGVIAHYYFSTAFVNKQLISYRRHGMNASCCAEKSNNNILMKIMFRFRIGLAFLLRIL